MIYTAYELLAKLRLLALTGVNEHGELEFAGTSSQWSKVTSEEESILRDYQLSKI